MINWMHRQLSKNLKLRPDDTFIASFPRSGNTWLRYLLADVIQQNAGLATGTTLPIHPDHVIPDIHRHDLNDVDPRVELSRRLIKTHHLYHVIDRPAVYLVRQPLDALVSFYRFHLRYQELAVRAADGPDAFALLHADQWREHVESYLVEDQKVLVATYEQLLEEPTKTLGKILNWLQIPTTRSFLDKAVEHHEFARHQQQESEAPLNPKEFFFRSGTAGTGAEALSPASISLLEGNLLPTYKAAEARAK